MLRGCVLECGTRFVFVNAAHAELYSECGPKCVVVFALRCHVIECGARFCVWLQREVLFLDATRDVFLSMTAARVYLTWLLNAARGFFVLDY